MRPVVPLFWLEFVTRRGMLLSSKIQQLFTPCPMPLEAQDGDPADGDRADGGQDEVPRTAEDNAKCRRKALDWLRTDPFANMVTIRNVLLPLQRLQRQQCCVLR